MFDPLQTHTNIMRPELCASCEVAIVCWWHFKISLYLKSFFDFLFNQFCKYSFATDLSLLLVISNLLALIKAFQFLSITFDVDSIYTLLLFGGLVPLCGIGVVSLIVKILNPLDCNDLKAVSRPDPGPLTCTVNDRGMCPTGTSSDNSCTFTSWRNTTYLLVLRFSSCTILPTAFVNALRNVPDI